MRATRLAMEPAVPGWRALRATPPGLPRSRRTRPKLRAGSVASAALHIAAIALLVLLGARGSAPPEEQTSPSFAIQFTDGGEPSPSPPAPASQPQVNLGGSDMEAPPPQPDERSAEPLPPPAPHYGTALRPRANNNPFAHVMPFDLRPQQRQQQRSLAGNGRGLDLSAGPVIASGRLQDSVRHVMGTHGASDWGEQLREFVEEHKYYPREAADNGEQGSAVLRVTVSRDGTVKRLTLVSSSGSHLLDAAWMAVFRDNRLPPFNDDMSANEVTFNYELDYSLIYRN